MSLFSRLFGGSGKTPEAEPQAYNGFDIIAEPIREG
ncbi:MAG: HlyU family transcriptional regulator, partial [Paracoccaceae bacterium]